MSPLQTAALVTAITALLMLGAGAWVMHRYIPALDTTQEEPPVETTPQPAPVRSGPGRHRLDEATTPYRPAAGRRYNFADPAVVQMLEDAGARMIPVPLPPRDAPADTPFFPVDATQQLTRP